MYYYLSQYPNSIFYNDIQFEQMENLFNRKEIESLISIIQPKIDYLESKSFTSPESIEVLLDATGAFQLLNFKVMCFVKKKILESKVNYFTKETYYDCSQKYARAICTMKDKVQILINTYLMSEDKQKGCKRKREGGEELPTAKKIKKLENPYLDLIQSSQSDFFIPLDIIVNSLIPSLSTTDIFHLALTNKKNLSLFFQEIIANQICLDPSVRILDFSSVAGSAISELNLANKKWTDRVFIQIFKNCPNLKRLNLNDCKYITDISIKTLTAECTNLQSLWLDLDNQISSLGVQAISKIYTNLTDLSFENMKDSSLYKINLENCTKLKSFNGTMVNDEVEILATNCTNLEKLSLSKSAINQKNLIKLFENCTNLKSLNLCNISGDITDANLVLLSEKCTNIRKIYLCESKLLTNDGICLYLQNNPHLSKLGLSHMKKLSDRSALAIAEHCSNLSHLDLSFNKKMTNDAIAQIVGKCTKLTDISIEFIGEKADYLIISTIFRSCQNLRYLCICTNSKDNKVKKLIDEFKERSPDFEIDNDTKKSYLNPDFSENSDITEDTDMSEDTDSEA